MNLNFNFNRFETSGPRDVQRIRLLWLPIPHALWPLPVEWIYVIFGEYLPFVF